MSSRESLSGLSLIGLSVCATGTFQQVFTSVVLMTVRSEVLYAC